jgi:hypothetical protein
MIIRCFLDMHELPPISQRSQQLPKKDKPDASRRAKQSKVEGREIAGLVIALYGYTSPVCVCQCVSSSRRRIAGVRRRGGSTCSPSSVSIWWAAARTGDTDAQASSSSPPLTGFFSAMAPPGLRYSFTCLRTRRALHSGLRPPRSASTRSGRQAPPPNDASSLSSSSPAPYICKTFSLRSDPGVYL